MTAIELLALLNEQGITLSADGADLRISAPRGGLTPELRGQLVTHKAELLDLLRAASKPAAGAPSLRAALATAGGTGGPLSFAQERLWFLDQLEPGNPQYNLPAALRLVGTPDCTALGSALQQLGARHEVLRTCFAVRQREPVSIVEANAALWLEYCDLRHLQPEQITAELTRLCQLPFDLGTAPLLRCWLLQTGNEEHILLLVVHHIIADGATLAILLQDLAHLYDAAVNGATPAFPSGTPLSYSAWADWQRRSLSGSGNTVLLEYWRRQLAGAPLQLELPTDFTRPARPDYRGAWISRVLPLALLHRLQAIAHANGASLYMVLLAAFATLLWRYCRQDDLLIGTPVAGRLQTETEAMAGLFVNSLVIRGRIEPGMPFEQFLQGIRDTVLDAINHQELPFEQLVNELQPERAPGIPPLFQVLFNHQSREHEQVSFTGLETHPEVVESGTSKFDLSVLVEDRSDGLAVWFEYSTELFRAATIEQMQSHYARLLEAIADQPGMPLAELPLMTAEQLQALERWNATHTRYPGDATLVSLFEQQVARTPDATALIFGEHTLSYQALNEKANQLAHYLGTLGIRAESRVGVFMERSAELVVALYGILKAGAAYVPLDPDYPRERIAQMLDDAGIGVLICDSMLAERLPAHTARLINLKMGWDAIAIGNCARSNPPQLAGAANAAYVIFTSGSTGRPKGVVNEHRGVCNRLLWMQEAFGLTASDRVLQKTPFSFDVSVWEFFWPLQAGATLVVAEPGGHRDTAYLTALIRDSGITTLHFVPSMLRPFLADPAARDCRSIRRVICSGEALTTDLVTGYFDVIGAELHNLYGPTEAAIDVTHWPCEPGQEKARVPIGRPIANTCIYIVDEHGNALPPGIPGELWIGGVQVARGYLNRPELTAERFTADPFSPGGRVYRTGDLARWRPDGAIEFLGRIDFQLKLRGFRIEAGEIEAELQRCEGVREAVVILREDTPGDQRLVAYIAGPGQPDPAALRSQLSLRLPDYMVPAAFVQLDSLPLTASGKLDRRALPAPDWSALRPQEYNPPRTTTETVLCEIWADLLKLQRVGIHADFFRLGGHSLLATRLVARIRDTLERQLSLRDLFDNPTVAALAEVLERNQAGELPPAIVPRPDVSRIPLSAAQQRLWLLDQLEPGNPVYNIPLALHLTGPLDSDALQVALDGLAERHASLRTRFVTEGGEPRQLVDPTVAIRLRKSRCASSDLQRELTRLGRHPFRLDQGPLLVVSLLELDSDAHVLHLVMHHIIGDAWSTGVLLRDLSVLYNAAATATAAALPPLPVQYTDYAVWEAERLGSASLQPTVNYWREQLAGAPALLDLPTDRPRPAVQTHNGAWHELRISRELTGITRQFAGQHNATLHMVLLAVFQLLLSRYSRQDDIVVGTPVAGRQHTELDNLIGFFINTLPLRSHIDPSTGFAQLLAQVRQHALEAYAHQELPFERLVEILQPARDTSYAPVFQVMFILQNTAPPELQLKDVTTAPALFEFGSAKLDLTLSVEESGTELLAYFEYNTDLFDAATISRMAGHFEALLGAALAHPQQAMSALSLLTAAERQQLLHDWNDTARPLPEQCLHEAFSQRARARDEHPAIIAGDSVLSYRELEQRSDRLAAVLVQLGAGPDIPIGLCLDRTPDMAVALLGILKSGSAWLPLDPAFPADRLAYMLKDSGAPILLTEQRYATLAGDLPVRTLCIDQQYPDAAGPQLSQLAEPSQLAYVIYTSGSTGLPKGVAVTHGAVMNFLGSMAERPGLTADDRLLAVTTLSFDISILEIFGPLLQGGTVVLASRAVATDGFALARLLAGSGITLMQATPATWRMLLQTGWRGHPTLRLLCGGEALDRDLARQLRACGSELWNMYGPTETTIWSTCERIEIDQPVISVGRPIANTRCYVLDENLQLLPAGVPGELWIGGAGVARGYLHRPELTADRFRADPFAAEPDARMYRTGDLARYDAAGKLRVLGRTDFQVKLRGFRIELGEIENALDALPGIRQSIVTLREDRPGEPRLVAYYTGPATALPAADELGERLRERLPDYMVPAIFMPLDEFPLTPNGKVDRKQLPAPDRVAVASYVAPRNDVERALATIWEEVLDIGQASIHADFFALGGHSLIATRLIARIRDELGVELPLMTLFNHPTIAGIAAQLGERGQQPLHAIQALPRDRNLPLSYAQQRLWFLDELSPGDPMYNIPWVMTLRGEPDLPALQAAIDRLVHRHEAFRTVFPSQNGEPVQKVLHAMPIALRVEDLRAADAVTQSARLTELAQQRMSLATGPLAWFTLLRVDEAEYRFALVVHHIVFDAWSHGILLRELAGFYNAARQGRELQLEPLTLEFADYAGWQRDWYGSEDFRRQLDYWRNKLGDAPHVLELPTDKPRPPVQTSNGANIARMLPQSIHDGIKALAERESVSLFMLLLAAFNVLMARHSGQDDLLVGTPVSGRNRSELERIIGFFLHTLVIRAELGDNPRFREFLAQTRQTVLEAFAHQELPFETLVEALQPERDTSRHPLFQVHFVLQHVDIDWHMFHGLAAEPVEFEFGTAKFDIMFFVFDANDSLSVRLEYNTDLFAARTIERLIDHFEVLLGGIVADPDMPVGQLPLLPPAEASTLLTDWNRTARDWPADATMHSLFEKQVERTPAAIALLADGTDFSYQALNRRANRLARHLQHLGVGPEVLVAVCSERNAELITGMLAIQKAGGAYVPVDPEYPPQRIAHMLEDSGAPVLLTQTSLLDRLPAHAARVICLDTFDWSTDAADDANPASGVASRHLGYVIYTSGSTGLPKGVEIEHRNAVALIAWAGDTFSAEDFSGVLASTSVCFDLSVFEIFCPLAHGGRIVLVRDALALPDLDSSAAVTLINTVPSAMAELVRIRGVPASVRTVNLAGEPLSTALVNGIYALGSVQQVNDLYGPSEDTTYSTWTVRLPDAPPSIGRPIHNTQAYVLDPYGQPAPIGVPGELYLAGAGVTRGYRNRPDLTAQRYLRNPFAADPASRMYRTGDKVRYRDDGRLEFIGRLDHQVKLRGFRIELGEIETALASHPAVENTVVMAREDRPGDKRLVAYIVASTQGLEGQELERWEQEQVGQWQDLWQDAYSRDSDAEAADPAQDFKGWISSYTGEPIPLPDMQDWLQHTAAAIRSLGPRRVLEIGSGTGLIAGQIAPLVESYTATDFSAAAIGSLRRLGETLQLPQLELQQCTADRISDFPAAAYDTVILNSVAQYFPDIDYLLRFIRAAVERVTPGGHVFLGDLRNARLLGLYHTSVQLFQAAPELPLPELAERVRQRTEQEEELLIDPALFVALQREIPAITGVRIQLKRGRQRNELTRFRYDVSLEVNGSGEQASVPTHMDWNDAGLTLPSLQQLLPDVSEAGLLITAIPDARIADAVLAAQRLQHAESGCVAELREACDALEGGIDPARLFRLADEQGLDLQLGGTLPGQCSALFRRTQRPGFDAALIYPARARPWRDYGNDPLHGKLQRSLVPELRARLATAVPDYMMPSAFVILDAFPLTPNGKINRKALPAPERRRADAEVYVAPRTPVEEQLCDIWSLVLGIRPVGVHDDFFALGGHSLLATQLISRIRDALRTELPLMSLFNHPTVAGLAVQISGEHASVATAPIPRCDRSQPLPLSFAQQRLWFLDQLDGVQAAYNVPLALRLEGRLDIGALQEAVNDLVARHESLRTQFIAAEGKAVQVVAPTLAVPVDIVNLPGANAKKLQHELELRARTPFNLADGPLLRVHVLRADETTCLLLLVMHHIVSDGWSLGILARELAALYAAHHTGRAISLPDLPIQYADYAVWQRGWFAGEELRRQLGFWRHELEGAPALLQIPTDRPRPAVQSFRGAHINRSMGLELGRRLRKLAASEDCTLFMVLLTAYKVLLSRYAGVDDIVVGTPIAGRNRTEIEGLIGFFVNTLALRTDLGDDPDFLTALTRVRRTAVGAFSHQDLPFEKLVEELHTARDTSHPPIFQTLFVLQENLVDDIGFEDLKGTPLDFELGSAKFDLSLFMVEFSDGLTASIEYNTDLFEATTIERMLGHLEHLLHAVVEDPARPVSRLPLLDDAERRHVLQHFNATAAATSGKPVHAWVEEQAAANPAQPALSCDGISLTYDELNARANRLAHQLQAQGAGPGTLVAICAGRGIATATAVLAVLKSGAAYVPVDPEYPADRVQFMLGDSQAVLVLSESAVLERLPVGQTPAICLDTFDWDSGNSTNPVSGAGESVYVIYTSGSTGQPKGVELTHAGLGNLIEWQLRQPGLDQAARTLQFASLSFDVSFQELFTTWAQGGSVVLIDEERRRDFQALARLIAAERIERLYLPFAALQPLAEVISADSGATYHLQDVVVAGEQLQITPAIRAMFRQLGHARLHNQYGPSETHVVTAFTLSGDPADWMALPPIGTPVANTQVYVLDRHQQPVPVGVPGELYLGGVQVARGYINRRALTAERFLPDPFVAAGSPQARLARMYRTGDRVRLLADGKLEYLGRTDEQFKWRGFRIEPGELESLLSTHPQIRQAAVLLREDTPGDRRLVAYLVPGEGSGPDSAGLRRWLIERVPDYMVPSAFVTLPELPLTPSGKVARRKLPAPDYRDSERQYVPPRTPTEEILCRLWADVLGQPRIGIHDDFFELGGHSLLATQLISRVRDTLELELPLILLFNQPQVAGFAAAIEAAASGELPASIGQVERTNSLPLSFAQQRLWFLDQLDPGNPVYNVPWAMRLHGHLDTAALQSSIDDLVARHETLRTVFVTRDGKPCQSILPSVEVPVAHLDLRNRDDAEVQSRLYQLSRTPFRLEQPPLLRVHLIQTAADEHVLLLVLHHIIADGWSLGVLFRELTRLYQAHREHRDISLPSLPLQYVDYAVWQQQWAAGDGMRQQLDYWRARLEDAPSLLELPTDRPRGASQSHKGAFVEQVLPAAIHDGLRQLARRERSTLYMVCLAAFNVLLARYSGQTDICVGTPIAGRRHSDLEHLIGFFINTLVIRTDLHDDPSFSSLLQQVKHTALEAFAHQDVPFEKLVDELRPAREMSHAPLFQVAFILQNTPWDASAGLADITIDPLELDFGVAKFDLSLIMAERSEGLLVHFEYNTDLFDATTIERMAGHFQTLLLAIVSGSEARVSGLPLLTAGELRLLLQDWNDHTIPYATDSCIHTLIESRCAVQPDRTALLYLEQTISYGEMNRQANQLAHHLIGHGVGRGTVVGICLDRSPQLVVSILAVFKAGAAYVPLDPNYPSDRLAWMLQDCKAPVLITDSRLRDRLPPHAATTIELDRDSDSIGREAGDNPGARAGSEDLAYIIYTSGSTGRPKGVMIPHRGVCNLAAAQAAVFDLQADDRMLQFASMSFDASIFEIVMGLHVGAALVLAPRDDLLPGAPLLDVLTRHAVTAVTLPPTALSQLPDTKLPALQTITVAGEACPPELVETWGHGRRFFNLYGPTETTVWASYALCEPGAPITIGRPVPNVRLYVLDERLQAVPVGVAGELCIGGAGLALGYLNRPELTAERFVPDTFAGTPGARMYRSGDRVRWLPDGTIEFLGRIDEQIKIRGFRIEPGEVENALASAAGVREAVVIARGQGLTGRQLVAYLVTRDDAEVSLQELRTHLRQRLPEYMIPAAFVVLQEFPLTPNGKVDRKALPAPDENRLETGTEYSSPRTAAEHLLAGIWQDLLQREPIGIHDNFFEVGGDSILSIQIIARAAQQGLALTARDLFEHQTIAELAAVAAAAAGVSVAGDDGVQTAWQLWAEQLPPGSASRLNPLRLFTCAGKPDSTLLDRAFRHVLQHHGVMHATTTGRIVRPVLLECLSADAAHFHIAALARALQTYLDSGAELPVQALHFHSDPAEPDYLLIAAHRRTFDRPSWPVLLTDLQLACSALAAAEVPRLPLAQRHQQQRLTRLEQPASAQEREAEVALWMQQPWADAGRLPHVPATAGKPPVVTLSGGLLAGDSLRRLRDAAGRWRVDPQTLLLTAVVRAWNSIHGWHTSLLDIEADGRQLLAGNGDELRTIACLAWQYPVLLHASPEQDPGATLLDVQQRLRAVPFAGLHFGRLRYAVSDHGTAGPLQQVPQSDIRFSYLHSTVPADTALLHTGRHPGDADNDGRPPLPYAVDITLLDAPDSLAIELQLDTARLDTAQGQMFLDRIRHELAALESHCLAHRRQAFTAADFSLARLPETSLQRLLQLHPDAEDIYPLTPLQHGMLFHSLLSPGSGSYFARFSWRLGGAIDSALFVEAWREVVRRNTALRSSFHWEGLNEPVQIVHRDVELQLHTEDWTGTRKDDLPARLQAFIDADQARSFDLRQAPLMRLALLRTAPEEHRLIWSFHHAIVDGWSAPLVLREVLAFYEALRNETVITLPEPVPFRRYIEWLQAQDPQSAQTWWRRQLAGFAAPTPLPGGQATSSIAVGSCYHELQVQLPADESLALKQFAQQSRLTLNTLMQGAWALLLSRYSGEPDVLFGATSSGRPATLRGVAEMIGLFLNTLPVRVQADPDRVLADWLNELQSNQLQMRQFEYSSLIDIQACSEVPRGTQLFDTLLVFENYPEMQSLWTSTDTVRILDVDGFGRTNFPLTLNVAALDSIHVRMLYDAGLFHADMIRQLLQHFRTLLQAFVTGSQAKLADLEWLQDDERHRLVEAFNDTRVDYPADATLVSLFEEQVARTPAATALVGEDITLSYSGFNARVNRLAHYLLSLGIAAEDRVGVCMERSADMVTALYAVLKAGGAYVPLDPDYPAERLAQIVEDAGIRYVITESACAALLPAQACEVVLPDTLADELARMPATNPAPRAGTSNLAYVIFTSGSTGRPKGVMNEHRGICNRLLWMQDEYRLDSADSVLQKTPFSFDVSVWEFFWPLQTGARLVVARPGGHRDSAFLADVIREHGITTLHFVPSMLQTFLQHPGIEDCTSLQRVFCSGEALPMELQQRFYERFDARLYNLYGPTEAAVDVTHWHCRRDSTDTSVPIGHPVANTRMYIVDAAGKPVPPGVAGELWIGGVQVARGYVARPELTAERFIADPFNPLPGSRVYRTGDLARYRIDGAIEFLGRIDNQIKLRGLRIEPAEIEAALDRLPQVTQSLVMLREDRPGDKRLVAYLTTVPGTLVDATVLRSSLLKHLPEYMVPAAFVPLATFPLLSSGKVDRKALPAPEWQLATSYVAPRDATEETLARIWAETLGVERVGIHDDFFALGGHSLLAMKLASRLTEQLGINVPLDRLLNRPNIAALAEALRDEPASAVPAPAITPIARTARRPRDTRKNP